MGGYIAKVHNYVIFISSWYLDAIFKLIQSSKQWCITKIVLIFVIVKVCVIIIAEFNNGDKANAIRKFENMADKGNLEAMFWLGTIYVDGSGGVLNESKGYKYLKRSANGGFPSAIAQLGGYYFAKSFDGGPKEQEYCNSAIKYFKRAIQLHSNEAALNNLAFMYKSGLCVKRDITQSISLYEKAALKGSKIAAQSLADIYYRGLQGYRDLE